MTLTSGTTTHTYRTLDAPVADGTLRVGVWDPMSSDGPAPTVLAVHGITASHRAWPGLVRALPGVRVIAPDLRGRGRSHALPAPYGMAAHADDLAAVLELEGGGPVVAVGHSMGGFVVTVLAHRHPALVSRLVLVDGGVPLPRPLVADDATHDDVLLALLGPAAERLSRTFPDRATYRQFWRAHPAFADAWESELGELLSDYVDYDLVEDGDALRPASSYAAVAADSLDLYEGGPLLEAIAGPEPVRVPTAFLRAPRGLLDADPLYDPAWLDAWAPRLPHVTTRDVDDVNHYTIIMSPPGVAAVASTVREALTAAS